MVSRNLQEIMAFSPSTLSIATLNADSLFCAPVETLFTWPVELHGSVSEESLSHYAIYCIGDRFPKSLPFLFNIKIETASIFKKSDR